MRAHGCGRMGLDEIRFSPKAVLKVASRMYAKVPQTLVASGLRGDRRLLVDAIEPAYNASVCRLELSRLMLAGRRKRGAPGYASGVRRRWRWKRQRY
jgi:hypothetical protein